MHDALGLFLAQVLVVAGLARLLGMLAGRLGQPPVVGEMFAGILLGPTFLGHAFPHFQASFFAPSSLQGLQLASQVGVILYLLALGLELDPKDLRSPRALFVSLSGMALPFALGVGSALVLAHNGLEVPGKPIGLVAAFLGVAMSITAFPVLSRILADRGLLESTVGRLSLAAAALGDVFAWSALALVGTFATTGSLDAALPSLALSVVFVTASALGLRPLVRRLVVARGWDTKPDRGALGFFVLWAFASGLCSQLLGLHALFGAFLAGVVAPGFPALRHYLCERLEGFAGTVFLPLFFAWTGLRTSFELPDSGMGLAIAVLFAAAVGGKLVGCALPVRLTGGTWNDAVRTGILMNTRGLMELVALNVGLDLGILPRPLFAVLVAMAIFTTVMTGPFLTLWERLAKVRSA